MEATEHVDPPSGISLRLAVLVFVVSALLASGVFVVWSSFDMPTTDDPCARFVDSARTVCEFGPVQPG